MYLTNTSFKVAENFKKLNLISKLGVADLIVAVGGEDDKVVLRSVECFDPLNERWLTLACLPFAISKHGVVVTGKCFK